MLPLPRMYKKMTRAAHGNRTKKSPVILKQRDYAVAPLNLNDAEFSFFVSEFDDDTPMTQEEDVDVADSESADNDTRRPKYSGKINRSIPQSSSLTFWSFRPEKVKILRHNKETTVGQMKLSHRLVHRITKGSLSPLKSPIIARTLQFSDPKPKKSSKFTYSKRKK